MPSSLRDAVREFSDDYLLQQFYRNRDEYTSEAQKVLEEEIARRGISEEVIAPFREDPEEAMPQFAREEFVPFQHTFSQTDILLAATILREKQIPFFVDSPLSSDIIPTETIAERVFTIHVHRDSVQTAHEALDEHFVKSGGRYSPKPLSTADELRSICFHEIRLNDVELDKPVEVSFADQEGDAILALARRLVNERDGVEERLERPVFYFENLGELVDKLQGGSALTVTDLMSVLELLQIYCDQPQFPAYLNETAVCLLEFLRSITET